MMMVEVIQDIKVIEVSGFERRMFWYLILLMDPYCAGRGDEASKLKINIASCCLKGPKRRSTNGYCWRRCHHRHCHHDYHWCHLWCAVRVFTSLTFSIWNRLLLMTSTVIMNTKRKEQLLIIINSTPHTHSYLPLFFCSRCTMIFPQALDMYWHEDCLKCGCCDCRLGEVTNWPQLSLPHSLFQYVEGIVHKEQPNLCLTSLSLPL